MLMMRSKASKDLSRGLQVSSEISFLISVRKILPTSGQTVDLTTKIYRTCAQRFIFPIHEQVAHNKKKGACL